jgi:hypothetical protein
MKVRLPTQIWDKTGRGQERIINYSFPQRLESYQSFHLKVTDTFDPSFLFTCTIDSEHFLT